MESQEASTYCSYRESLVLPVEILECHDVYMCVLIYLFILCLGDVAVTHGAATPQDLGNAWC